LSSVVVIGGGISGIQASLDLADRGIKVYLVESSTSIGGTMAQLDKTFPTLDCSICILGPKMVEVDLSPNIELLTYSEVTKVEGAVGSFKVTVHRKPRYVNESCNGCGACAENCPIEVPNEYDEGLRKRKAIYIPFPQAIPLRYTIDRDACVGCHRCVEACTGQGNDAIDFDMTAEDVELNVSAIIVATGMDRYLPLELGEYGYVRYPNVLTALEFERLICASGPTGGRLEKPFDGKPAHRIVFVQCVGSRSQRFGVPYCSSVCCMYATKEAVLVKEHDPESEVTIFYVDLKVFGQGFQDFVDRARAHWGVEYIRGRPGEVREHPYAGDLTVWYEDTDTGIVSKKEADLVVLCAAMIPRPGNKKLAETLGVELDEYGFFKVKDTISNPVETGIPGIYVCGCCHGPKDIPESVAEASATAAMAAEVIEGTPKEGK
jgi:heterodisulfide reductase subunit A